MLILELIAKYEKALAEVQEFNGEIEKQKADLSTQMAGLSNSQSQLEAMKASAYTEQKEAWVRKKTAKLDKQLSQLNKEREETIQKYKQDVSSLNVNDFSDMYVDQQELIDELESEMELTIRLISDCIGEGLCNEMLKRSYKDLPDLSSDDLNSMVEHFNSTEPVLTFISKLKNPVLTVVSKIEDLSFDNVNLSYKYTVPVFVGVYLVLLVILSKFLFPIMSVILFVCCVYSLFVGFFCYKMLLVSATLRANIDRLIEELQNSLKDNLDASRDDLNNELQDLIDDYDDKIAETMNQLQHTKDEALSSFVFDESEFESDSKVNLASQKDRINTLKGNIEELNNQLVGKKIDLNKLQEEIKQSVHDFGASLSAIGSSFDLPDTILIDVNEENFHTSVFKPEYGSSLFLYNKSDDVYAFTTLWIAQLRSEMSPTAFNTIIYDKVDMGTYFIPLMQKTDNLAAQELVKIYNTSDEFTQCLIDLEKVINERNSTIIQTARNISEYNEKMRKIQSVQIGYIFVFVFVAEVSLLTESRIQQLIKNGGKVGIIINVFTTARNLVEKASEMEKVVPMFSSLYKVNNGTLVPISSGTVLKTLSAKK